MVKFALRTEQNRPESVVMSPGNILPILQQNHAGFGVDRTGRPLDPEARVLPGLRTAPTAGDLPDPQRLSKAPQAQQNPVLMGRGFVFFTGELCYNGGISKD